MALIQMKCTALDLMGGSATLTPQANVIRENEFKGLISVTIAASTTMLANRTTWELNAFYDVEISKSYA